VRKGLAARYWEEILLGIIGGQFPVDEVCGAVLSLRFQVRFIGLLVVGRGGCVLSGCVAKCSVHAHGAARGRLVGAGGHHLDLDQERPEPRCEWPDQRHAREAAATAARRPGGAAIQASPALAFTWDACERRRWWGLDLALAGPLAGGRHDVAVAAAAAALAEDGR
jgi:hypothetical protein